MMTNERTLLTAGAGSAAVALLFVPPLFGLVGFTAGVISAILYDARRGAALAVASIAATMLGVMLGLMLALM